MAGFAADVASLSVVRAISGQMTHLVASIAGLRRNAINRCTFWAASSYMPRLIAIIAGRSVRALVTLFSKVPLAVAPVATFSFLLAITGKVT